MLSLRAAALRSTSGFPPLAISSSWSWMASFSSMTELTEESDFFSLRTGTELMSAIAAVASAGDVRRWSAGLSSKKPLQVSTRVYIIETRAATY